MYVFAGRVRSSGSRHERPSEPPRPHGLASRGACYQRKEEEVGAFVAAGEAVASASAEEIAASYPIITVEAAARGQSVADRAAKVIVAVDVYRALAAEAEAARARLAIAVNAAALAGASAPDLAAMQAAADSEIECRRCGTFNTLRPVELPPERRERPVVEASRAQTSPPARSGRVLPAVD